MDRRKYGRINLKKPGKKERGIWEEIELPRGISKNEWISQSMYQMYSGTIAMYDKISHSCTSDSCKVMGGGPKYQYYWSDEEVKVPIAVTAPNYVQLLKKWVEKQLSDEKIFPTQSGANFPPNFSSIVQQILRRLFRVYVHIYYTHFQTVTELGQTDALNQQLKLFYAFTYEFNLITSSEIKPLEELIEKLFQDDEVYQNKKLRSSKATGSPNKPDESSFIQQRSPNATYNAAAQSPSPSVRTSVPTGAVSTPSSPPMKDSDASSAPSTPLVSKTEISLKTPGKVNPVIEATKKEEVLLKNSKALKILVEYGDVKKRCDITVNVIEDVRVQLAKYFNADPSELEMDYFDEDFREWVQLESLAPLDSDKVRIKLKHKLQQQQQQQQNQRQQNQKQQLNAMSGSSKPLERSSSYSNMRDKSVYMEKRPSSPRWNQRSGANSPSLMKMSSSGTLPRNFKAGSRRIGLANDIFAAPKSRDDSAKDLVPQPSSPRSPRKVWVPVTKDQN